MRRLSFLFAVLASCSGDDGSGGATGDGGATTGGTALTPVTSGTSQGSEAEETAATPADAEGDGSDSSGGDADSTGDAPMACGSDPGFSGSAASTIEVAGVSRTYLVALPDAYDPDTQYPLIFAWHGRGGSASLAAAYFGIEEAAAGEAIVVYPDGLPLASMGGATGWELEANSVDVQFFDAVLEELSNNLCVDSERIFSTGHSFGGYMSNTIGCARPDVVRAIAPVAGGGPFFTCDSGVSAWITHGNPDGTVPFSQGEGSRDVWVAANGCSPRTQATAPDPCVAYQGCAEGSSVVWCPHTETGQGGHLWPSFAAEAIWGFFAAF